MKLSLSMITRTRVAVFFQLFFIGSTYAQLTWPQGQILPSFPSTAQTQDLITLHQSPEEMYLFASLKGVVNRTQPRIFSYEGDAFAEGKYAWLQSLGLSYSESSDRWNLISKYRSEINGLIVYDPTLIHTVNLATTLAVSNKALIASPSLLPILTASPYNLPVLMDLRGQFASKVEIYQKLFDDYWADLDHRLLIGLDPQRHTASLREYAVALGVAVIWLDPAVAGESELLNSFLSSMPANANYMGWWPEEGAGVMRGTQYGIATIASDWSTNLTVHSGMPRTIKVKPIPPKPALENKIYVAFVMSDGDNLQYVEHLMRKLWEDPNRGNVPIGWTISPAMVDVMPGALNYFHQSATANDNLISGPSGYGYVYPNYFADQNTLNQFIAKTEEYNLQAGLRVITVWNTIVGGIDQQVGEAYEKYAPSLLGVTAQNTGGPVTIYNENLPGFPLSCNYCWNEENVKQHIAGASEGWAGTEPRFVIIQTQPWQDMTPTRFKRVVDELKLNPKYVFVRPDHLFQLLRESNGLEQDPGPGPVNVYRDCEYAGGYVPLDAKDYTSSQLNSLGINNDDVSAIRIGQGFKTTLFYEDNFTGDSVVLHSSSNCLDVTVNNATSSIRVTPDGDTNLGNTTYYLQNRNSGLYMEVNGLSMSEGATVVQKVLYNGNNQQFQFTHLGNGLYKIQASHSGKAIEVVPTGSKGNGAGIVQSTYQGNTNQQFILVPASDGYYKLIARHSARNVDVVNSSKASGAGLHQWENNNQTSGQWKLIPLVITAVNDEVEDKSVTIYPNPTQQRVFFAPELKGAKVGVISQTGVRMIDKRVDNNGLDVSDLRAGVYIITIEKNGRRITKRLVKM